LDARFQNTTITDNIADQGGGVWTFVPDLNSSSSNDVRLTNSIASANKKHNGAPSNLWGSFNIPLTVFNIIGTDNINTSNITTSRHDTYQPQVLRSDPPSGNIVTDDPKLAELAWNGGPTRTRRPTGDSDAIDAGSNALAVIPFTSTLLTTDQRGEGFPRVHDVHTVPNDPGETVDIGAYEIGIARVVDVVLDSTQWAEDVEYSYAEVVMAGNQLRPVYLQNANRIEVHFNAPVTLPAGQEASTLSIRGNKDEPIAATIGWVGYNPTSYVATWSLSIPLTHGKYALVLSGIQTANGVGLDGDWTNYDGVVTTVAGMEVVAHTPDNFADDTPQQLVSGDGVPGGTFEYYFSVLPGDSNQDGVVYDGTYTSYPPVPNDTINVADINGDGLRNSMDVQAVQSIVAVPGSAGEILPLTRQGDYDDDDIVDADDYRAWVAAFDGNTAPFWHADGNRNGVVDVADFTIWRANASAGMFSAWHPGVMFTVASLPTVDFDNAPRVVDVLVSGSSSTHAPFSFATVDGSGLQLRTVPVGAADTISIVFSEDVNVSPSNLRVVGLQTGNVPTLAEFRYDIGTMTASWRLEAWTLGDQYLISLSDAVTDIQGNRLDGEWTNPAARSTTNPAVSEFPSGDNEAGGNFNFVATLLGGDFNLDGVVNQTDADLISTNWTNEWIEGILFTDGDANGDGWVNSGDFAAYMSTSGINLQTLWMLADLNGDFDVDSFDVDWLMDRVGMSNPTWADGDLNGDGTIDEFDIDLIFAQYGMKLNVA
jgi:hypothetical protein